MSDLASTIQAGDVIMPPERELRLWMRRHVAEKGLPESALHLKVEYVARGIPDKRGEWILLRTRYPEAWGHQSEFRFKVRPGTPWTIISRAVKKASAAPDKSAQVRYVKLSAARVWRAD